MDESVAQYKLSNSRNMFSPAPNDTQINEDIPKEVDSPAQSPIQLAQQETIDRKVGSETYVEIQQLETMKTSSAADNTFVKVENLSKTIMPDKFRDSGSMTRKGEII